MGYLEYSLAELFARTTEFWSNSIIIVVVYIDVNTLLNRHYIYANTHPTFSPQTPKVAARSTILTLTLFMLLGGSDPAPMMTRVLSSPLRSVKPREYAFGCGTSNSSQASGSPSCRFTKICWLVPLLRMMAPSPPPTLDHTTYGELTGRVPAVVCSE